MSLRALRPLLALAALGASAFQASGQGPLIHASQPTAQFGVLRVGTAATIDIEISNIGDTGYNLEIYDDSILGSSEFSVISSPPLVATLMPGESETWTVQAAPSSSGSKTATLVFVSNSDGGSSLEIPLGCVGVEPVIGISPASVDFGEISVGQSRTESVSVECIDYAWSSPLTIHGLSIVGPGSSRFTFDPISLPVLLDPGATFQIRLHGMPTVAGPVVAQLWIESDAANDPIAIVDLALVGLDLTGASPTGLTQLHPLLPSVFRDRTRIAYSLERAMPLSLNVFDSRGRLVRQLISAYRDTGGAHQVFWDGSDVSGSAVAAGVYFVVLVAEGQVFTERVVRLR